METGVFYGMSDSDYRKIQALNASTLKKMRRSPLHAMHALTQPEPPTRAMQIGTAVHLALLEPDRYLAELRIGPANDRRTKAWQDWDRVTLAMLKLTPDESITVEHIRTNLRNRLSGTALKLLSGKGTNEATAVWCDVATGQHCKARADRITRIGKQPVLVELKTARDASERAFKYAVRDFGYDLAAAWYLRGFGLMLPEIPERLIFVVVETEAPYAVGVYELSEAVLMQAAEDCERYLREYVTCIETRSWPGYPDAIVMLGL
jgi:exodeoxyribonuclease VIII